MELGMTDTDYNQYPTLQPILYPSLTMHFAFQSRLLLVILSAAKDPSFALRQPLQNMASQFFNTIFCNYKI